MTLMGFLVVGQHLFTLVTEFLTSRPGQQLEATSSEGFQTRSPEEFNFERNLEVLYIKEMQVELLN